MSETRCTNCGISNPNLVCDECKAKAEQLYCHCEFCGQERHVDDNCECEAYDSLEEFQANVHHMIGHWANDLHDANDDRAGGIKCRLDHYQQVGDHLDKYLEDRDNN